MNLFDFLGISWQFLTPGLRLFGMRHLLVPRELGRRRQ